MFGVAQRWLGPKALKQKGSKDTGGEKATFLRKDGARSSDHRPWIFIPFLSSSGHGIPTVLAFEDVGIKLEASVKIGLDGIKIKIDRARVGCTELLKHVLKRSKQAMQVPHDFGFMWF